MAPIVACLTVLGSTPARGACNLIPSATLTFRSTLGTTNRPYAAPGDYVEVAVRSCDATSPGLGALASDHAVTVVFTPPSNGTRRVAFLTTESCATPASQQKFAACEDVVGAGRVACFGGTDANLQLVNRGGVPHLSFRFPDTDALATPDGDDRTLSGPATIAVTPATAPLPCALAKNTSCATQAGAIVCIDDLYAADGSCQANLEPTFPHFTALPVPNDYQAACFADDPPCTALATETRYTVDTFGNLLMPINWQGILVNSGGTPVPRLMHAAIRSPLPVPTPPAVNLGSFTPEGAPLPPIFEPQVEPGMSDPNVLRMFGSADAAYTVLRLARRAGTCACGDATGDACVLNGDCPDPQGLCAPGQVRCPTICVGGSTPGAVCTTDGDCAGSGARCGTFYADFRPLAKNGTPILLARTPLPDVAGVCQVQPNATCQDNAQCTGLRDPCVAYSLEANTPVPLESITTVSTGAFGFAVSEPVANEDLNGDGDLTDSVVTLRDRATGETQPLGGQSGCDLTTSIGRAVVRSQHPPFTFPAAEAEGDVLAFLESEANTTPTQTGFPVDTGCDENADGDDRDAILRVFRLGPTELATSTPRAVDGATVVNGRALALSEGQVFFRTPEGGSAPETTVSAGPLSSDLFPQRVSLSADGRYVAFATSDDLSGLLPVPVADGNGLHDVYVRDIVTDTLELGSVDPFGMAVSGLHPSLSPDGRWLAFVTVTPDLVPGMTAPGIVLRDRCVSDGVPVPSCTPSSEVVSVASNGMQPIAGAAVVGMPTVSADGRFVLFQSMYSDLVPGDTNTCEGTQFAAGDCPDVFLRDRCVSNSCETGVCRTRPPSRAALRPRSA